MGERTGGSEGDWSPLDVLDALGPVVVLGPVRDAGGRLVDLRFRYLNPAMAEIAGSTPDQLVGRCLLECFPAAGTNGSFDACRHALESGTPFRGELPWSGTGGYAPSLRVLITPLGDGLTVSAHTLTRDQLLAELVEQVPAAGDAVFALDPDGTIAMWGPAAERMYGWTADEVVGRRPELLVPADHLQRQREAVAQALAGHDVAPHRTERLTRDGARLHVQVMAWPLRDGRGDVAAVALVHRDIGDTVAAEEAAAAAEQRLRVAMDAVDDQHVVLEPLRDGTGDVVDFIVVDVNRAVCEYVGMTRDMIEGARLLDTIPGVSGWLPDLVRVLETGEPLEADDWPYEHELIHQERRYRARFDRTGPGLSLTVRDVTPGG